MSFPCPHCGGEIETWAIVDVDDLKAQRRFRRRMAVYVFLDQDGDLLYIGQTQEPTWRWRQHRRLQAWWGLVERIAVLPMPDRHVAYVTEQRLIGQLQPRFNIRGRQ